MNIFDLRGPAFLQIYVTLLLGAFAVTAIMRWLLRGPGGDLARSESPTDPYDIAYLTGGPRAAVAAAAMALAHRGLVGFSAGKFRRSETFIGASPPRDLHPTERAVFNVIVSQDSTTAAKLVRLARDRVAPSRALIVEDFIVGDERQWSVRLLPMLGPIFVLLIGLTKIGVGLSRGKPVAILVVFTIIALVVALAVMLRPAHRTRRGDRALKDMRLRNAALRTSASSKPQTLEPLDVAMACALFGPVVFANADGVHRDIARKLGPHGGSDGSFSVHSCGGGGGCGGGGCGGCGGGD